MENNKKNNVSFFRKNSLFCMIALLFGGLSSAAQANWQQKTALATLGGVTLLLLKKKPSENPMKSFSDWLDAIKNSTTFEETVIACLKGYNDAIIGYSDSKNPENSYGLLGENWQSIVAVLTAAKLINDFYGIGAKKESFIFDYCSNKLPEIAVAK